MPNIIDPKNKKKNKVTRTKVGKAPDKSGDGAVLTFERGKETRKYTPKDERTGSPAYGNESKTNPTPGFVKRAQDAHQDIVHKNGLPYRAGHTKTTKAPDKINYRIKVTPDIRPVKMTVETENPVAGKGRDTGKSRTKKLKARRFVAGGSDRNDNPANKVGVGRKSGIRIRRTKSFRK